MKREHLEELFARLRPGARVVSIRLLGDDEGTADSETHKAAGYGRPRVIELDEAGRRERFVVHVPRANPFGHDRRADRVADVVLAHDSFGSIPAHAPAVDAGLVDDAGGFRSFAGAGEPYLVTGYSEGRLYADDLRRIARDGVATAQDSRRGVALARYLAALHDAPAPAASYTRHVRDVVGSGEGIFGLADSLPDSLPEEVLARVRLLEHAAVDRRWEARRDPGRARRIHGDFHPFNILVDGDADVRVLDASRGCQGDPADDLVALAINYVFFALDHPGSWPGGLGGLWHTFWTTYRGLRPDPSLLEAAPLYLAWRTLVLIHPTWYPEVSASHRSALLDLAERAMRAGRFDPTWADELFPQVSHAHG